MINEEEKIEKQQTIVIENVKKDNIYYDLIMNDKLNDVKSLLKEKRIKNKIVVYINGSQYVIVIMASVLAFLAPYTTNKLSIAAGCLSLISITLSSIKQKIQKCINDGNNKINKYSCELEDFPGITKKQKKSFST